MTKIAIAHADRAGGAMDILDIWAVELEKYAEALGYNVIDISGPDMTYDRMPGILEEIKPALLINFSFGGKTCLWGNPIDGMTKHTLSQDNLDVLKGIAVISYSNYTAGELGQNMIKAGCPSLAGFSDNLIVVSDKNNTQYIFKDCLLLLAKRVLMAYTMGEATEIMRRYILNQVKLYKTKEFISIPLFYNGKYLTQFGDPGWKLRRNL